MSDLVAELRNFWGMCNNDLVLVAADEIERLTAAASERDEWKAAAQEACDENNTLRAERERLERARDDARQAAWRHTIEITRLRAALERVLACFNCSEWEDEPMMAEAFRVAREALAGASNSQQRADIRDGEA